MINLLIISNNFYIIILIVGKTYTMIGTPSSPGIMARAVDDIFHLCANQKKDMKSEVCLIHLTCQFSISSCFDQFILKKALHFACEI